MTKVNQEAQAKDEKRKMRKVIVERKRRKRIDRCFEQLRYILVNGHNNNTNTTNNNTTTNNNNNNNDTTIDDDDGDNDDECVNATGGIKNAVGREQSRCGLEKADILECTLEYIVRMQDESKAGESLGYERCFRDVAAFLANHNGGGSGGSGGGGGGGGGGSGSRDQNRSEAMKVGDLLWHLRGKLNELRSVAETGSGDRKLRVVGESSDTDCRSRLQCDESCDDSDCNGDSSPPGKRSKKCRSLRLSSSSSSSTSTSSKSTKKARSQRLSPLLALSSTTTASPTAKSSSPLAARVAPCLPGNSPKRGFPSPFFGHAGHHSARTADAPIGCSDGPFVCDWSDCSTYRNERRSRFVDVGPKVWRPW